MRSRGWIGWVLVLAACGPQPIALDGGDAGATTADTSTSEAASGSTASTASTEESEVETDDDSEDPSAGFVPEYDISPLDDCSVFNQDCPDDYKCVPSIGADYSPSRCVPVLDTHGVGEACEFNPRDGSDDCDANSHCWAHEPPYTDECRPLCVGTGDDPSCPGQGETCNSYTCHIYGQIGIPVCELSCDPLAQACGENQVCNYSYEYFGCGVAALEPIAIGQVCDWGWDCEPGLICVAAEQLPTCAGPSCCTPYCGLGDDPTCANQMPGTVCVELPIWEPVEGCPMYGMCALP